MSKTEFLPRIAQSDKSAAQECVEVYGSLLRTPAKQFTDSNALAEKAVQKIFLDSWENAAFDSFRREKLDRTDCPSPFGAILDGK